MRKTSIFFLLQFMVCMAYHTVEARWAGYEDAPIEIEFCNNDITIEADGSMEHIIETQEKILKEQGKEWITREFYYNEYSERVTILKAKVIHGDKEYILTPNMIEDKPLASSPQGIDQIRQILLSFPHLEMGAKVYLKFSRTTAIPILTNCFSKKIFYGRGGYCRKSHTKLHSKLPLHMVVNDPVGVLKITKDRKDNFHALTIDLIKPICRGIVNEPSNSYLDPKEAIVVSLSTMTNWLELSTKWAPKYIKRINQKLPEAFEAIATAAKQVQNEVDQINTVTSLLNDKIKYMGDWRTTKGKCFPRKLKLIASAQLGDCKDFSIATAAILQSIGYKVQIALVLRGERYLPELDNLPDVDNFNHAIIKVTDKQGRIYWIDPTNDVSMADGIFPDIAGKMALVLDIQQPSYEQIPSIDPTHSKIIQNQKLTIQDDYMVHNVGSMSCIGEMAIKFTGAKLFISDERLKDWIFHLLSGTYLSQRHKHKLVLPNLNSRIVKDLTCSYIYDHDKQITTTNIGPGIVLNLDYFKSLQTLVDTADDQVGSTFIGKPATYQCDTTICNVRIKQIHCLNYEVDTPWVKVKRSCIHQGKDTEIKDIIIVKQPFVLSKTLHTADYKRFKNDLSKNFLNTLIVLEPEQ